MDAALDQLRAEGFEVRDDDVARLSPLGHGHINMLGRYALPFPIQWPVANCGRSAILPPCPRKMLELAFLFRCYSDPYHRYSSWLGGPVRIIRARRYSVPLLSVDITIWQ